MQILLSQPAVRRSKKLIMSYLDTQKSVIISSPAGSGKTEKLARRYIALLKSGVEADRILAVTFTDKAAAEMKQRILKILRKEDPALFDSLIQKMPLMRVSTMHSFCGTLLRRFSFEAKIDPNYRVENAIDSRIAWEDIIYGLLMETGMGDGGHELFLRTIGEKGFRGLANLNDTINTLYEKRPFSLEAAIPVIVQNSLAELINELRRWDGADAAVAGYDDFLDNRHPEGIGSFEGFFLTKNNEPRKRLPKGLAGISEYKEWTVKMYALWKEYRSQEYRDRAERIMGIFRKCIERYSLTKRAGSLLDFSDLEYISFKMLTEEPEWANILYAFDEKTDHILVDEFQDTNNFQWAIIDSLTEEWRSGIGAKRAEGIKPTIFLVGDEKQSIYLFRGANVEIFHRAKEKLAEWLGNEFLYEEAKENYRSAPEIIGFTNTLFSKIMSAHGGAPAWLTRYGAFDAKRNELSGKGKVEVIILDGDEDGVGEERSAEADVIARKINRLVDRHKITERGTGQEKECRYMDVAILLKKRTHLKKYEEALRNHGIPFVAVKGIGFYQEPEVAMLRALVFFLSNPHDDYSLYILLKSPLFNIDEGGILGFINNEGDSLFGKMKDSPAITLLLKWLSCLPSTPLSELMERALVETGAWAYFHDAQKSANIKKFIRLIEELEASGKSIIKIRAFLQSTLNEGKEPKANVNTEGMDAVKIMTIHAAKGLEFPIVFIPGVEEPFNLKTDENLVYEEGGGFFFKSVTEPSIRKDDADFRLQLMKEEEEHKRLFYVAVTRAEEALFLVTRWKERGKSFLSYLKDGIGLHKTDDGYAAMDEIKGLSLVSGDEVMTSEAPAAKKSMPKHALPSTGFIHLPVRESKEWKSVTGDMEIRGSSGSDWAMPGNVLHKLFEDVSEDRLHETEMRKRAETLFKSAGAKKSEIDNGLRVMEDTVAVLKEKGVWQKIIKPAEGSYTELPFILESGGHIYKGRIDRVIKSDDTYNVYDYKTFPVTDDEMPDVISNYSFQLQIYKKAVKKIFNTENVRSFIVFTYTGDVREV